MNELNLGLLRARGPLMIVLDRAGRLLLWNYACSELTGYTFEEVQGRCIWDVLGVGDDAAFAKNAYGALLAGEHPGRIEGYIVTKSGERRWIGWSHDLTRRPDGQIDFVTAIGIDRTDAKAAEDALRVSEAKFAGIISISADAIISIDEQQRIVMYNEGAEQIFGWSSAEVLGKPLDILIPERFRDMHRKHVEHFAHEPGRARRMGEIRPKIFGRRKNGEEFPASAAISKLEVEGRRLYTVALRDITELKQVEHNERFLSQVGAALSTTLDYNQTLAKIAELAVRFLADCCIIDLAEDDGKIRRWGVVHRDPSKADIARALEKVSLDRSKPHLAWTVLATQTPQVIPTVDVGYLESIAQNGEHLRTLIALRPTSYVGLPLSARDRLLGAMILIRCEQQKPFNQDELRLAEELAYRASHSLESARLYRAAQDAIRARDEVLSIVAHDLRNPLNAAQLAAGTLQVRAPEEDRRQGVRKAAQVIHRSLQRANRLIQDLLDVTRLESGTLCLKKVRVPAMELLAEVSEAYGAIAASSGIDLDVASANGPDVLADKERAVQALSNLVGNAIKFTPPGGTIRVAVSERERDVCFSVADNGPGIASEHVPHLFDRFWQAKRGDQRGAGLGLPIAKGIVEGHGGQIWVESTPGRGSTFHFTLPAFRNAERRQNGGAPAVVRQ